MLDVLTKIVGLGEILPVLAVALAILKGLPAVMVVSG